MRTANALTDAETPARQGGRPRLPLCGAQKRRGRGPCELPAGWGTPTPGFGPCRKHLGMVPNFRKRAARQAVEAEAREMLRRRGLPADLPDPEEAIDTNATEVESLKAAVRLLLEEKPDWTHVDLAGVERESALLRWDAELHRLAHDIHVDREKLRIQRERLGIADRRTKLAEAQHQLLRTAVAGFLDWLEQKPTWTRAEALEVLAVEVAKANGDEIPELPEVVAS